MIAIFVGVASVVIAVIALPLQRGIAGAFLVISAVALLSLLMPLKQWRGLHRGMTFVLGLILAATGISFWIGPPMPVVVLGTSQPTSAPTTVAPPPPSPEPSSQVSESAAPPTPTRSAITTPPTGLDVSRLIDAFRAPGDQSLTASIAASVKYQGGSALEIRFVKKANYYEAYFDLRKLFPSIHEWAGHTFSCYLRPGDLKSTDAPWGGVMLKDKDYKYSYGADVVFFDVSGEWIELTATVGRKDAKNRNGGLALYDPAFSTVDLNGFAVFLAAGNDSQYMSKLVHISQCTHKS